MKRRKTKIEVVDKYEKYDDIELLYATTRRNMELLIPSNFRMLCAILGVRPESILHDFMWLVSYSSLGPAQESQREAAQHFFLARRFGQPRYSHDEIKAMFKELQAMRTVYDTSHDLKLEGDDQELFWKNSHMYMQYWFKHWFGKSRNGEDLSVLAEY